MTALILLFISTAFLFFGIKRLRGRKTVKPATAPQGSSYLEAKTDFTHLMYELLESIAIMTTTKNRETLNSRYQFVNDLTSRLSIYLDQPFYSKYAKIAIAKFEKDYRVKIDKDQAHFLLKPQDFEAVKEFYAVVALQCFLDYYNNQKIEIGHLKQKNAILKRYERIENLLYDTLNDIEVYSGNPIPEETNLRIHYFKESLNNEINQLSLNRN